MPPNLVNFVITVNPGINAPAFIHTIDQNPRRLLETRRLSETRRLLNFAV